MKIPIGPAFSRKEGPFLLFFILLFLIPFAPPRTAGASPHFETLYDHKILKVDGLPFLNLSAHLEENDAVEMESLKPEEYLNQAKELGFTAVQVTVDWDTWEERKTSSAIRTNDITKDQLEAMVAAARSIGMKINICWEGTNVSGRVNHAPSDIYHPIFTGSDRAGTFHPDGDFPPPSDFDFINDPANYQNYIIVTDPEGEIAADTAESRANYGIFCWNWPNILKREKAALQDLARWIRDQNEIGDVVITLQIESEIREAVERGPVELTNPRCRCSLSDFLYENEWAVPAGFDQSMKSFGEFKNERGDLQSKLTEDELFNQWSEQSYMTQLVSAVRDILPGLPLVLNSFGDDDPASPEIDNPGTLYHDVKGWLATGVDIVGPDMYGFREEVFQEEFDIDGNVLWVPEIGAQYEPHFQIFAMFGSNVAGDSEAQDSGRAFNGIGYSIYTLYGDISGMFTGLISDGITRSIIPASPYGTWFQSVLGARYHAAFYTRNSITALASAMSQIAKFAGTENLLAFFDRIYLYGTENFQGGIFDAGDARVSITDEGSGDFPARGVIVMTNPWDFTILGANYKATLLFPARGDEDFRAERGYWRGDEWNKVASVLEGTFSINEATGYPSVTLSKDNVSDTGPLSPGSGSALDLQYIVRVYSAPPIQGGGESPSEGEEQPGSGENEGQTGGGAVKVRGGGGCSALSYEAGGRKINGYGQPVLIVFISLFLLKVSRLRPGR